MVFHLSFEMNRHVNSSGPLKTFFASPRHFKATGTVFIPSSWHLTWALDLGEKTMSLFLPPVPVSWPSAKLSDFFICQANLNSLRDFAYFFSLSIANDGQRTIKRGQGRLKHDFGATQKNIDCLDYRSDSEWYLLIFLIQKKKKKCCIGWEGSSTCETAQEVVWFRFESNREVFLKLTDLPK